MNSIILAIVLFAGIAAAVPYGIGAPIVAAPLVTKTIHAAPVVSTYAKVSGYAAPAVIGHGGYGLGGYGLAGGYGLGGIVGAPLVGGLGLGYNGLGLGLGGLGYGKGIIGAPAAIVGAPVVGYGKGLGLGGIGLGGIGLGGLGLGYGVGHY